VPYGATSIGRREAEEATGAIVVQPLRIACASDGECATRVPHEAGRHLLPDMARGDAQTTHNATMKRHDDVKSVACGARRFTHFARLLPISFLSELLFVCAKVGQK
jgi:hypothetical protein